MHVKPQGVLIMNVKRCLAALAVLVVVGVGTPAYAAAIVPAQFDSNTLPPNDDGSTGLVNIGFAINFFGTNYTQLYVNNNGNVTFTGSLFTFTPFSLLTTATPIIAPFFGDVDTGSVGDDVTYGTGMFDGHAAFGVNWLNVDYFPSNGTHTNRNDFQLIMVDRSDTGAGNFDFIFNYDRIQWEAGMASGSTDQGCRGSSARVGYSNGATTSFELAGSAVNGAFLDSGTCVGAPGPNALIMDSLNSNIDGRYVFNARNGTVVESVPEPATLLLLLGVGLAGIGRRFRSRLRGPQA